MTESTADALIPNTSAHARPLHTGSNAITTEESTPAAAVKKIGRVRAVAAFDERLAQRHAFSQLVLDEFDEDDRVAHDDADQRDEADHRGRRKVDRERCQKRESRHDADHCQRHRREHDEWRAERPEPRDQHEIDQDERQPHCAPEIGEDGIRQMPFAAEVDAIAGRQRMPR